MPTKAMYAGSFDPITNGHVDVIQRASKMFDELVVAIGINPKKPGLFDANERLDLVASCCKKWTNVTVVTFSGLTAEFAKRQKCRILVRGLRDAQDFGFEMQMAHMNRHLEPSLETIFIPTLQELSDISSSLVKEVASLGGNITGLVPPTVIKALGQKNKSSAQMSLGKPQQASRHKK